MAYKLIFPTPIDGLPFIWNISAHVGCKSTNPNYSTDVELIQFFLREQLKSGALGSKANTGSRLPDLPVDGKFTSVTGFWIFYTQLGGLDSATVDGVVSPARGGTSYGGGAFAIAKMNFNFKKAFPDAWQNLDKDPRLSPALRAQLTRTTP